MASCCLWKPLLLSDAEQPESLLQYAWHMHMHKLVAAAFGSRNFLQAQADHAQDGMGMQDATEQDGLIQVFYVAHVLVAKPLSMPLCLSASWH